MPSSNFLSLVIRFCCAIMLGALMPGTQCIAQQISNDRSARLTERELVDRLGHARYHERMGAYRRIQGVGPTPAMLWSLEQGQQSDDLEIRLSSQRLLLGFDFDADDQELARLVNPRYPSEKIRVAGWAEFSSIVGSDMRSRRVFAKVFRRYSHRIKQARESKAPIDGVHFPADLDPTQFSRRDPVAWQATIFCCLLIQPRYGRELSDRVAELMRHPGRCPLLDGDDLLVTGQLIDHWLNSTTLHRDSLNRLTVAMRYGLRDTASKLCRKILHDPIATPHVLVTALLASAKLNLRELDSHLQSHAEDGRTSHVWTLIAGSRTRINTQVRDVVAAIRLHRAGADPRDFGFAELQADSILVYQPHSLGFCDQATREKTLSKSSAWLVSIEKR